MRKSLPNCWVKTLQTEFEKPYFVALEGFLSQEKKRGKLIYPPQDEIFNAFRFTPLDKVKVVLIGQDPYHGPGQAHGLCFSVNKGATIPPSLRNIFKELRADLDLDIPVHGDLRRWAYQGVFLLNTILTVEEKSPSSHKGKGWETFTDCVIQTISKEQNQVVFLLWGAYARTKKKWIDPSKHLIIESAHPAAEVYAGGKAGFFGSRPFSKANHFLDEPVDWQLIKES